MIYSYTLADKRGAVLEMVKSVRQEVLKDLYAMQDTLELLRHDPRNKVRVNILEDKIYVGISAVRNENIGLMDALLQCYHLFDGVDKFLLLPKDLFLHQWTMFHGRSRAFLKSVEALLPAQFLEDIYDLSIGIDGTEFTRLVKRGEF